VLLIVLTVVLTVIVTIGILYSSGMLTARNHQAEVAARGAQVMPFDLDATTHIFQPHDDGGIQQVIADDPSDTAQITLIRAHLQEEGAKFQRGDFSDPTTIHGMDMPGVAQLQAGYARITVTYTELPKAQLRYTTSDPALVTALRDWFAAQTSDHGEHAASPD
jgi:type II secretory pathway pseudopilin PulG